MRNFFLTVLISILMLQAFHPVEVYASNLPETDVSIYLDGYPIEGLVVSSSTVNVYEDGSFDDAIDTLEPGTVVTLMAQHAYRDGNNYFYIKYSKDGVTYTGLVDFYSIEPIGVDIAPEGVIDVSKFHKFSLTSVYELIDNIYSFATELLLFLKSLPDLMLVIFPFLNLAQIDFFNLMLIFMVGLSGYFFFKKVF